MLVNTADGNIHLIHDWIIIRTIPESIPGNKKKFHLVPLPHFDEQKFPFIALSGTKTMNLINVQDLNSVVSPLIINTDQPGQRGFFFTIESFGASLHFTSKQKIDQWKQRLSWIKMDYKEDFFLTLRSLGRLPRVNGQLEVKLQQLEEEKKNVEDGKTSHFDPSKLKDN